MKASIIIATHNRRDLLLKTLASIDGQTVGPERYEVVVCVDGSSDGTIASLAQLRVTYPLQWVFQAQGGASSARNRAAELARHDVFICLDDDQLVPAHFVARHLEHHENGIPVLVQGPYPLADGYDARGASLIYNQALMGAFNTVQTAGASEWNLWGNNFSVSAATWRAVGGFDESFRNYGGEDTDFGLRVRALGVPFIYEPGAMTRHMHHLTYAGFRRQSFMSGRAAALVARRHGLPSAGVMTESWPDRLCAAGWRQGTTFMEAAGLVATLALRLADRSGVTSVELAAARVVRRIYRIGGVVAGWDSPPVLSSAVSPEKASAAGVEPRSCACPGADSVGTLAGATARDLSGQPSKQ